MGTAFLIVEALREAFPCPKKPSLRQMLNPVPPKLAKAFETHQPELIEEVECWSEKSVIIRCDSSLHWEEYDIC